MSVSAGQLIGAIEGLNQLGVDTSAAASLNLASLPMDATVAEDALAVVAVFWPPAGVLEAALGVAVALAPLLPQIHVEPDSEPEVDAQTAQSRGGRNY